MQSSLQTLPITDTFSKRIKWSPDSNLLLSIFDDGSLTVYDKELKEVSAVSKRYGGFNDFEWYPWMNWMQGTSCCFVSVSKSLPIELWNIKGDDSSASTVPVVRSSWIAKDHLDQVSTCFSVSISPEGKNIVAGGQASLWSFDITRPGCESLIPRSTVSSRKRKDGQTGIICNICFRQDSSNVFSACSFDGTVGVYDLRSSQLSSGEKSESCAGFKAHKFGASQSKFFNDGWSLVTVGRKENCMKIWDLRMLGQDIFMPVTNLQLEGYNSSQRIFFDSSYDDSIYAGSGTALFRFKNALKEQIAYSDSTISSVTVASNDSTIAFSEGSRQICQDFDSEFEDESNLKEELNIFKISLLST